MWTLSLLFYCLKIFSVENFDLPVTQSLTIKGLLSCFHDGFAFATRKEKVPHHLLLLIAAVDSAMAIAM